MKQARKYFLVALAVVVVDQVAKVLIKTSFEYREAVSIMGDFLKFQFIENRGAAFGLTVHRVLANVGIEMSAETGKLTLTIFSIIAVGAIGYVLFRLSKHKSPLPLYLALIFGGAIGNIIDRTFYGLIFAEINNYEGGLFFGRVVDYIYFDIYDGPWPTWVPFIGEDARLFLWPLFNVADAAISVGIVVILIFQGKFFKMHELAVGGNEQKAEASDKKEKSKISEP